MLKEFNKNFGITSTIEEEKCAFVNRCSHFLQELRVKYLSQDDYNDLFSVVCMQLGFNPKEIIKKHSPLIRTIPELGELLPSSFINSLKIITTVRNYYSKTPEMVDAIDVFIEGILDLAATDLGITYKSGMFFPKGDELLDKELIGYSLSILAMYPNEDKDLRTALNNYRAALKYGVIEFSYRCIEGLSRQVLKNNKTLIDNKAEIVKASGLSDHWKKILANYIDYGNEYGRHASENRHDFNEAEVEAYLYTTCILVRLIVKMKK